MASERSWLTPYNFVQNNPILRIDPDGRLDGGPDGFPMGTNPMYATVEGMRQYFMACADVIERFSFTGYSEGEKSIQNGSINLGVAELKGGTVIRHTRETTFSPTLKEWLTPNRTSNKPSGPAFLYESNETRSIVNYVEASGVQGGVRIENITNTATGKANWDGELFLGSDAASIFLGSDGTKGRVGGEIEVGQNGNNLKFGITIENDIK